MTNHYPANLFYDVIGAESYDEMLADYMISHLPRLEASMVRARYQEGKTYKAIGAMFNVSGTCISTRCKRALRIMKAPLIPGVPLVYEMVAQALIERDMAQIIDITPDTPFWEVTDICEIAERVLPQDGIETLSQIAALSYEDILSLHGIGMKTATRIQQFQKEIPALLQKGTHLMDTKRYALWKESSSPKK